MGISNKNNIVSIITPLYNSSEFLEDTIRSVINQSYQKWEMIIVDDCSADNSFEIVQQIAKHEKRIKLIRLQSNQGAAIARNIAIENAIGDFIAFLDSDDLWEPKKLEKQINFMTEKDVYFCYSAYNKIDEDGTYRGKVKVPNKVTYNQLLNTNVIGCLTAIYNANVLGKIYMPNIRKRQDYALWLKILKKGINAYGINEPLATYRVRNNSISSNKLIAAKYQWQIYRRIEKINFVKSVYHFLHYAYYGYKKYRI